MFFCCFFFFLLSEWNLLFHVWLIRYLTVEIIHILKNGFHTLVGNASLSPLILEMVMEDRRLSARQRAARLGISQERVGMILTKVLGLRMVPAQWIPHLLSRKQKRSRWPCAPVIWNFSELIKATFGLYLEPQAIPGPNTTSWIQRNSRHELTLLVAGSWLPLLVAGGLFRTPPWYIRFLPVDFQNSNGIRFASTWSTFLKNKFQKFVEGGY